MGVGVSGWRLARAVSLLGCLGMVSSTGLDTLVARRLQLGDPGGHMRRAFSHFPVRGVAERVLEAYFVRGGKRDGATFKPVTMFSIQPPHALVELTVLANFAEVYLAREGHGGKVGINLLEKIQLPTLPSLFGALLAGVDVVAMGAGIPRSIPGILDELTRGNAVTLKLDVRNATAGRQFACEFSPRDFCGGNPPALQRPAFLAVISSATLAITLARKASGSVEGFVVEGPTAGGHNAPPRGSTQLSESGEPIYSDRDVPDLAKIRALGLPFWLAGSCGTPEHAREARSLGAMGVQVGTPFAFCEESGVDPDIKRQVVESCRAGTLRVFTDPQASPTGFPFKVAQVEGSIADPSLRASRDRVCDLGYLREVYEKTDGTAGYRCAGEPLAAYARKGGTEADTANRICVCNGLMATAGAAQVRAGGWREPALVTAGDSVCDIARFVPEGADRYHARDVVRVLLEAMVEP
jgi:nitronate monooxygenase